ncbi:MAG: Kelch repeat-containing protein [Planctomycetota bacterium]|jgi:hypothetical protein
MHTALRATCLAAAALTGLSAADAQTLTRSGGALGASVTFDLAGDNGELAYLLVSGSSGPTPLALVDPTDPRVVSVGLDLISLWTFLPLVGGVASQTFSLPADAALQGAPIFSQFITLPGVTTLVDDISNSNSFALCLPGSVAQTVGDLDLTLGGHTATALPDGRVLLAGGGGDDGSGTSSGANQVSLFDPQTQSFTTLPFTLNVGRVAHVASLLNDGRVFVCGGTDDLGAATNTAEIIDVAAGTATLVPNMAVPRIGHSATTLADGRVWVAGGITSVDLADPLAALDAVTNNTQVFNPGSNSWSGGPNLSAPRAGQAATRLNDGRVLFSGGLRVPSIFGLPLPEISSDARVYNPGSNSISNVSDFSGGRALHNQLLLPDGRVLSVGGLDGDLITQVFNTRADCWVFNGSNWTQVAPLNQARAYGNLHVVSGNRVAVVGGLADGDLLTQSGSAANQIELIDAATLSGWSSVATTLQLRPALSSATIDGGERVLITGTPVDALLQPLLDFSGETFLP